jgi:hypothetical protein
MKNGKTSGEEFREKFLIPSVESGETVYIELDGTIGYGSSFLEEAFGGLVRKLKLKASQIESQLILVSEDTSLIQEIKEYLEDASKKLTT